MKYNKSDNKRTWLFYAGWLYFILLTYLVFFMGNRTERGVSRDLNLILFYPGKYYHYSYVRRESILMAVEVKFILYEFFGNILLFLPFVLAVFGITGRNFRTRTLVLCVLLATLFIETVQHLAGVGYFDIDDIVLNTAGGVIGIELYRYYLKKQIYIDKAVTGLFQHRRKTD